MLGKEQRIVDGQATYQYRKLAQAMLSVPEDRRRVAIDIGSHVGLWAMQLVKLFDKVECFEPNPEVARLWPWNVRTDNARLWPFALGKIHGKIALEYNPKVSGNAHVTGIDENGIEMRPLDSFEFEQVDFIKIDVEGYESLVLKGAEKTIRKNRPVMVLEQKGNDGRLGFGLHAGLKLCKRWGMRSAFCIGGDHILIWD